MAGITVFSSITVFTGFLGKWQLDRYHWKVQLLEDIKQEMDKPPAALPSNLSPKELEMWQSRRVTVSGVYDGDNEVAIGPRPVPKGSPEGVAPRVDPLGYLLVTPIIRPDGSRVLVNRGWVPASMLRDHLISGSSTPAEVTAIVRPGEKPSSFFASSDRAPDGTFPFLDVAAISKLSDPDTAYPLALVDKVDPDSDIEPGTVVSSRPTGRRPNVSFPLQKPLSVYREFFVMPWTHLVYCGTWFTLAAFGVVLTWFRFRRPALPLQAAQKSAQALKNAGNNTQ